MLRLHLSRSIARTLALCLLGAAAPVAFAQNATEPKPAEPAAPAQPPQPAIELPKAADVLARATEALGGKDALMKLTSIETRGSVAMPALNIKGASVTRIGAPNRMFTEMELGGIGKVRSGFDGTNGWVSEKISGPRLMTGKELETLKRDADFFKDIDPTKRWDSIETVAATAFQGIDCWELKAKLGDDTTTLWYERETGLQRGMQMTATTQLGKIPVTTFIAEYRDFDSPAGRVKLPVRTELTQMGQKLVTTVDAVEFDKVPAEAFELPKEIKALLEPEPADEDGEEDGEEDAGSEPAKPTVPPAAKP